MIPRVQFGNSYSAASQGITNYTRAQTLLTDELLKLEKNQPVDTSRVMMLSDIARSSGFRINMDGQYC